jgi:hypothetical protein
MLIRDTTQFTSEHLTNLLEVFRQLFIKKHGLRDEDVILKCVNNEVVVAVIPEYTALVPEPEYTALLNEALDNILA